MINPVRWEDGRLVLLDQTRLPAEEVERACASWAEVADAIRRLVVRGAPAIGVAAAFGVVLAARESAGRDASMLRSDLEDAIKGLAATRPTAVNLFWALDRMRRVIDAGRDLPAPALTERLLAEARAIQAEDLAANHAMGAHGLTLVPEGARVLTHCNAGALATAGYGTALGVIRGAAEAGKRISVLADETRPFLQGARLTAWELVRDGIQTTVITDSMAGALMRQGQIDLVVVGADRIAANGDTANKIGTYTVAVLAREHHIPFYVAAPLSTVDLDTPDGHQIPIEERNPREVTHLGGSQLTPEGALVRNPAFDVTPHHLIAGIITERGVCTPPYAESLKRAFDALTPAHANTGH
jgi:methylthioribose-1-phosphate isomerase